MAQVFLNNARGMLTTSIDNLATSLTLEAVVGFPTSLASGDYFLLTLYADTTRYGENIEVVKVTGLTDNGNGTWTLTVERGYEFTAVSHAALERAESRLTAGTMDRMDQPNDWVSITGKPDTATRWPQFSELTLVPGTASRWPAWNEVTSKPTTYPPSAHTHTLSEVTDSGTAATYNVPASGDAASWEVVLGDDSRLSDERSPTSHNHSWDEVISKPVTATRWPNLDEVGHGVGYFFSYDVYSDSTASTLDVSLYQAFTVDATTTARNLSLSGSLASYKARAVVIDISGNSSITWPSGINWSGGSAPELNVSWTEVTLFWNGSTWRGFKTGGAD